MGEELNGLAAGALGERVTEVAERSLSAQEGKAAVAARLLFVEGYGDPVELLREVGVRRYERDGHITRVEPGAVACVGLSGRGRNRGRNASVLRGPLPF